MKRGLTSGKIPPCETMFCLLMGVTGIGYAATSENNDPDLLTLIQLMETDIATRTDLQDPDKAPGLVTVLRGEELRARGYQLVKDALNHQAGFDITIDSRGIITPAVRGIGGIRSGASGKIKLLVNGTMVNIVRAGSVEYGLEIPIDLVDRIEIIRGPGSAVHGEFAYAAVVNVIIRKGDTEFSAFGGGDDNRGVNGMFTYTSGGGVALDLAGSYQEIDPDVNTGPDALYNIGQEAISLAPGKSNEYQKARFLFANLGYENSELRFHWSDAGSGDYFGLNSSLAPHQNEIRRDNRFWFVEGHHLLQLGDDTDLKFKGGYKFFRGDFKDITVQPPGYYVEIPAIPAFGFPGMTVVYPDGIRAQSDYEEERYDAAMNLTYRGLQEHTLLLGTEYSHVEDTKSSGSINLDLENPNPLLRSLPLPEIRQYRGSLATIMEGEVRKITSVYAQDEYRPNGKLTVTLGVRFDGYSDVSDSTNPRLAAVYEFDENNIFKAQFGTAFRPPTYAELYSTAATTLGNPDIKPETIETYEIGWIYKKRDMVFRATLFNSDMDDLIVLVTSGPGTQRFSNTGGATSQGLALDAEYSLNRQFRVDGNLTWLDTEDHATHQPLEGVADLITNINLVYQPRTDFSLNLTHHYVSKRHRNPLDPRQKLNDYQTLDLTANAFNLFGAAGFTLRGSVYNLFDQDVYYPAALGSYPDDFPRPGRTWLVELTKTFK